MTQESGALTQHSRERIVLGIHRTCRKGPLFSFLVIFLWLQKQYSIAIEYLGYTEYLGYIERHEENNQNSHYPDQIILSTWYFGVSSISYLAIYTCSLLYMWETFLKCKYTFIYIFIYVIYKNVNMPMHLCHMLYMNIYRYYIWYSYI